MKSSSFVDWPNSYDTSSSSAVTNPPLLGDIILNASNAVLTKVLANLLAGERFTTMIISNLVKLPLILTQNCGMKCWDRLIFGSDGYWILICQSKERLQRWARRSVAINFPGWIMGRTVGHDGRSDGRYFLSLFFGRFVCRSSSSLYERRKSRAIKINEVWFFRAKQKFYCLLGYNLNKRSILNNTHQSHKYAWIVWDFGGMSDDLVRSATEYRSGRGRSDCRCD